MQRYNENPDGAILKNKCFAIGMCMNANEIQLIEYWDTVLVSMVKIAFSHCIRKIQRFSLLRPLNV
jgi:hypothetical protein